MLVTAAGLGMLLMPSDPDRPEPGPGPGRRAWRPACPTSASRSAARSGWPCSAPWPGPWWPTPRGTRPRPRRQPPTAANRRPPGCTPPPPRRKSAATAIYDHALSIGFSPRVRGLSRDHADRPDRVHRLRPPGEARGPGRGPDPAGQPGWRPGHPRGDRGRVEVTGAVWLAAFPQREGPADVLPPAMACSWACWLGPGWGAAGPAGGQGGAPWAGDQGGFQDGGPG